MSRKKKRPPKKKRLLKRRSKPQFLAPIINNSLIFFQQIPAKNAIDGVRANLSHGEWPYESWGINRRADATMKIEFGRKICTDRIVFYTRADFPHDNYWTEATVEFSDGTSEKIPLTRTSRAQEYRFEKRVIDELVLKDLIKSDEPSPFPALTQIEVYGTVWNGDENDRDQ